MKRLLLPLTLIAAASPLLAQGLPPAAVQTGKVERRLVKEHVSGVATVEPWLRTVLSAEIAGLVKTYPLREGSPVTAHETVVCELKTESMKIDLEEAEALLARAEAESANSVETAKDTMEEMKALRDRAQSDLERSKELLEKEVVNQAEYDRAEADAIAAGFQYERAQKGYELARAGADPASQAREAEVRRAKARLARVNDQIRKARIVSPVSGLVVRRMTEVGSWVTPGSAVIEIVTIDPVLVRIGVNESDIPKLKVGDGATVTLDALPGRSFTGKVRFIVPEADPKSRSFPVFVEVGNSKTELKAGMFARVEIAAGEGSEALTVPKDALVTSPRGTIVYTLAPMTHPETGEPVRDEKTGVQFLVGVPVPVRTGLEIDDRVVVEGRGLDEGVDVITTGNEKLIPGQPVLPPGKSGPPAGGGGGKPPDGGGGGRPPDGGGGGR